MSRTFKLFLGVLTLIVAGLACNFGAPDDGAQEATVEALRVRVERTATAAALDELATDAAPQTAVAEATATSQAVEATQAVDEEIDAEAQQATATAAVPVLGALRTYGVDSAQGRIGWMHPPVDLLVEGYQQFEIANDFMSVIAADFVISADITWNTQYGTSGCGFMLRSDGDQNQPSQYMVIATRGGTGHVLLVTLVEGEIANGFDIYARGVDRSFAFQNDTTNTLAVVGRGNIFEIFSNGTRIGEIDVTQPPRVPSLPAEPAPPLDLTDLDAVQAYQNELAEYQELLAQANSDYLDRLNAFNIFKGEIPLFEQGFMAMTALSESGRTNCKFDNAWLWLIEGWGQGDAFQRGHGRIGR